MAYKYKSIAQLKHGFFFNSEVDMLDFDIVFLQMEREIEYAKISSKSEYYMDIKGIRV